MGVQFTSGWKGPQKLPFNEKQVRKILQKASGTVGKIARSDKEDVTVTAGPHKGGRPKDTADCKFMRYIFSCLLPPAPCLKAI